MGSSLVYVCNALARERRAWAIQSLNAPILAERDLDMASWCALELLARSLAAQ